MKRYRKKLLLSMALVAVMICILAAVKQRLSLSDKESVTSATFYETLPADTSTEDPLAYIDENFQVEEGFSTNLPVVVIHLNEELADYKKFTSTEEIVYEDVEPWTTATFTLLEGKDGVTTLEDEPTVVSNIMIKKKGHTSYSFDKSQYYIKLVDENGEENPQNLLGMGKEDGWILNGSMADKSMMRNYIAYRTAASIMEYAPKCSYCEVLMEDDGVYTYQGVYLLMDSIGQGKTRINIEKADEKNKYSSYIVRRDRYTSFDTILDTYGRLNGIDDSYIGVKYPSVAKQTDAILDYMEKDFSSIEEIIYSEDMDTFKNYDRYIDVDSFVDYFLINEYFGNYDAGEHSTYMYKEAGSKLKVGPVWDFDQAMNNSSVDETDPTTLAMQEKTFFKQLCQDKTYVGKLKTRYAKLREGCLSDEAIFSLMDETDAYLTSARAREWYRWAADYLDNSGEKHGNYYLSDYEYDGETISRFTDNYEQEIYNIRTYLKTHGAVIQQNLTSLEEGATVTSGVRGQSEIFFVIICVLLVCPSILINRR